MVVPPVPATSGVRRLDLSKANGYSELLYRRDPRNYFRILLTYEVKYVIVGVQEYRFGNPDVLASFGDHPALVKVFENGKNAIYNVDEDALWTSVNS